MLCLNVSSAREYSVRFVADLCLDWPQLPPSPGFLWWDDLDVSSVLVITPEVPISKGEVLIFRQRVETEVVVRSVQFCVFTCLLTPQLRKPALPPCSHM